MRSRAMQSSCGCTAPRPYSWSGPTVCSRIGSAGGAGFRLSPSKGPPGPNRILESLDGIADVRSVTRTVSLTEDPLYLGSRWAGETAEWKAVRRRLLRSDLGRDDLGQRTSSHLAKLWANDEVAKLASLGISDREHAVSLATSYQIVTPVSGAVVLETQTQYEQAGLKPADPADVPTIP